MSRTHLPILGDEPVKKDLPDSLAELFGARSAAALGDLRVLAVGPSANVAARALGNVLEALRRYRVGDDAILLSLEGISPEARVHLADALGAGEVVFSVAGRHPYWIQETMLAGLWRVRQVDDVGEVLDEFLEVADVPSVVRAANREATRSELVVGEPPSGVMNALPVLAELAHRIQAYRSGDPNHVVSFTLLPMNAVDMRFLQDRLGRGPVRAESRGYGHCRVELTGHRHIWSVQYDNSMGALILDTLEVGDVPVSLRAAAEDFEDSAGRLAELIGVS